jgi:hypothetical protein
VEADRAVRRDVRRAGLNHPQLINVRAKKPSTWRPASPKGKPPATVLSSNATTSGKDTADER